MKERIGSLRTFAGILAILVCTAVLSYCGGGGDAPAPALPSGKVVQGEVSGAVVFADHASGPEANFEMEIAEGATASTTADDGTFTLPVIPSYNYVVVSFGGTDKITGQPAMSMLAPPGVNTISPLTTMVAMDPGMAAVIQTLGVDYRQDISRQVTPAAALLVHSIQAAVTTLTKTLSSGANASALTSDQITGIQRAALSSIAAGIKNQTAAQVTSPTTLTATLQTAMKNALDAIVANPQNSNIIIGNTQTTANTIVTSGMINTVATSVDATGTFSTAASAAKPEDQLISPAAATAINTSCQTAATTAAGGVTVTPKPNVPAISISGTPATQVLVGATYIFKPTVTSENSVTFSIVNKPAWLKFSVGDGGLEGQPTAANVGTTFGIVISVSDGLSTKSLPAFSITVSPVTGAAGGS